MKCQLAELGMLNNSDECWVEDAAGYVNVANCENCSWYINNKLMEKKRTAAKRFVPMNEKDYKIDDSVSQINHKYKEERKRAMKISQLWQQ
jgi:Zn-finger nucleic acid-binding protein